MEPNPRKVFLQLFGEGDTPQERATISTRTNSLLDLILDGTKSLKGDLGNGDRAVLDGYLESVREIERRTQKAAAKDLSAFKIPEAPVGELDAFAEQVKLMFDLIALAYQADLTRVASYIMVAEGTNRTYNHIGVPDSFHPVSHHANDLDEDRTSWRRSRPGTWSSSRTSSRRWRRRRTARARCSITRSSCTDRT